jgi:AcrR family transcriptional regulator
MSIVVEHDKRRRDILKKALEVFVKLGYEDVTFQKIADRCSITRTTLYIYFRNKREIFNFSIKQFLNDMESNLNEIKADNKLTHKEKLVKVMTAIFDSLTRNAELLKVVVDYLNYMAKGDYDPDKHVRRRTVRARHILSALLIEGARSGEFVKEPVKDLVEMFYGLLEAAVYRLVILRRENIDDLKAAMLLTVDRIVK